jgi:hypothetical protein
MNLFLIKVEGLAVGIVIFISFLVVFFKLPKHMKRWAIHHALITDLVVAGVVFALHWGTLGGTMGATVAGILTALFTSVVKPFYRSK